jgi:TIR domain-containing protein
MPLDLFISYAVEDKLVADAICAALEAGGVRCWIAPRDINPGAPWADAIIQAIQETRIMVVVFSSHSNHSQQVTREVSQAVGKGDVIIPFRIEDIVPSRSFQYYLSTPHWLDALTPPLEEHIRRLVISVQALSENRAEAPVWSEHTEVTARVYSAFDAASEGEVNLDQIARRPPRNRVVRWLQGLLDDK